MNKFEVLPSRVSYTPDEPIEIEIRNLPEKGDVSIWYLGTCISRTSCNRDGFHSLGLLSPGGYGIEVNAGTYFARTAVEVADKPRQRVRYGFVADYSPDRELSGVEDNIRRLHLSGIQFYDWAYRHADLLGGGDNYLDALSQPISLDTVKNLVTTVQGVGAMALGYAAVYAVGQNEWELWKEHALLTPTGSPYGLGDFLFILDPASKDWLVHFTNELTSATHSIGFDGFHLDQYGYPKIASRADGAIVDVADSFDQVIRAVRSALPQSNLIFNNVNDFPTWVTVNSPQDVIYIEVWPPHVTLNSLGAVVTRAKNLGGGKPILIAAYQHVYDESPVAASDLATKFTMATLFSHGASQILAGESDRILVNPYYVQNHVAAVSTQDLLKNWYDFLVEHDHFLLNPGIVEVTGSYAGKYNDECEVDFTDARVSESADAGTVWRRITAINNQLIVHLINLVGQEDTLWDSPRKEIRNPGRAILRVKAVKGQVPRVRIASPDITPRLIDLPVSIEGDYALVQLPPISIWQVIVIDHSQQISQGASRD